MATAYEAHPYRTPVVGWMNDLENMRVDDAREWYRSWYAPNNATLVVVGDVSAEEVFAEAQTAVRRHPGACVAAAQAADRAGAARHTASRRSKRAAELPYLLMGWHAPSLRDVDKDWEPYALEMLAARARRQRSRATESRAGARPRALAMAAGAGYDSTNRGPAMFIVDGTPAPGKTVQ